MPITSVIPSQRSRTFVMPSNGKLLLDLRDERALKAALAFHNDIPAEEARADLPFYDGLTQAICAGMKAQAGAESDRRSVG